MPPIKIHSKIRSNMMTKQQELAAQTIFLLQLTYLVTSGTWKQLLPTMGSPLSDWCTSGGGKTASRSTIGARMHYVVMKYIIGAGKHSARAQNHPNSICRCLWLTNVPRSTTIPLALFCIVASATQYLTEDAIARPGVALLRGSLAPKRRAEAHPPPPTT